MKSILTLLCSLLTVAAFAGDIVIYPGGFQTNTAPYYAIYTRSLALGWGWVPETNGNTSFTATYTNNVNVTLQAAGKSGDVYNMPTNYVVIPNPPYSPKYRFTVFYPDLASVPHSTNDAPLLLHNFKLP